jgi:hydroxylamine dehydrogenase
MKRNMKRWMFGTLALLLMGSLVILAQSADSSGPAEEENITVSDDSAACVNCHSNVSSGIVMEWKHSQHAKNGIGCYDCHSADKGDIDGWTHQGKFISTLVSPKDCSQCHDREFKEFTSSHHAKAGEILASLDNVLAEKAEGIPGHQYAAVNGCWQCHGTIINFIRDDKGNVEQETITLRDINGNTVKETRPKIDTKTWPNSGMGRLNPDGSKGSCHSCHSRHDFNSSLARQPENCGKCHMGPDHPQIEIYNESKHGISFRANIDRMNLNEKGDWVLGKDYSAAPTCTTCHMGAYKTADGVVAANNHDLGERISWTLRPEVSKKINLVVYEDGYKEDYTAEKQLPKVGDSVDTIEKNVVDFKLVSKTVSRKVAKVITWDQRRETMMGVCANCHAREHTDGFYEQFDGLVDMYNTKFAIPAGNLMADLKTDGLLPGSPFTNKVQWTYYELWHHEGRRARHGAAMMGPDYTHWHGTYEVAKAFYTEFLPQVVEQAEQQGGPDEKAKYDKKVKDLLDQDENIWLKGLTQQEMDAIKKEREMRYGK